MWILLATGSVLIGIPTSLAYHGTPHSLIVAGGLGVLWAEVVGWVAGRMGWNW